MNAILAVLATLSQGAGDPAVKAPSARYEIDPLGRVLRRDGDKVLWAVRLDGDRDPQLLCDSKRVYVGHPGKVTALAAQTGVILWTAKGPTGRLLLYGDQLLVTLDAEDGDRWVISRAVTTGAEISGFRLPKNILAGVPLGSEWVFLSNRDVVRRSPKGVGRWAIAFAEPEWPVDGGFVGVGGGDLVAFRYCPIADSGVQLVRLNPASEKVVWKARCAWLGVGHSKYRHDATVALDGDRLRVTSRGSSGSFVEDLDVRTGKQLKRTVSKTE